MCQQLYTTAMAMVVNIGHKGLKVAGSMPWVAASYGLQLVVQKWHFCRPNGKEAVMHPYQKPILAMGSKLGRKELTAFKNNYMTWA